MNILFAHKALYKQYLARFIHIFTGIHKERKKEAKKERKATTAINLILILIKSGLDNGVYLSTRNITRPAT